MRSPTWSSLRTPGSLRRYGISIASMKPGIASWLRRTSLRDASVLTITPRTGKLFCCAGDGAIDRRQPVKRARAKSRQTSFARGAWRDKVKTPPHYDTDKRSMDSFPYSPASAMEALERGASIVTGNQRAARALHGLYREHRRDSGSRAGQTATILPWDAWTASLWRRLLLDGADERLLLNRLQEQIVWRDAIEQDGERETLRTIDFLTKIARSAWELLGSYGGRELLRPMAATGDTQTFARWAERFERRCHAEGLLSAAQLEQELRCAVEEQRLRVEGEIFLLGSEGITPAQAELVDALEAHGCSVRAWSLLETEHEVPPKLMTAASEQDELHAAALWTRQMLERNPDAQIAIIVPELEAEKAEIDRVFREVLAPELGQIGASTGTPYEFSLGAPLIATSMIAAAMDLLRWTIAPLQMPRISALLLSPYFGLHAEQERGARAEFDAFALRRAKLLQPEISLRWMRAQTAAAGERLSSLSRVLTAIHQFADEKGFASDRIRDYAEWMEDMRQLLRAA